MRGLGWTSLGLGRAAQPWKKAHHPETLPLYILDLMAFHQECLLPPHSNILYHVSQCFLHVQHTKY